MGCTCVNVEVGSYDNQVILRAPAFIQKWKKDTGWTSPGSVCVDACLENEIRSLWALGIITNGCCCGHHKVPPYIGVEIEYAPQMEALGYEHLSISPRPENHFVPKSVPWPK